MSLFAHTKLRAGKFKKDADGSVSVEFVLWIPFLMLLMMLVVDTSILFTSQSNYWNISRETARLVSRHAMTEDAAESYATAQAGIFGSDTSAAVSISGSSVTVNLTTPASSLTIFNALGLASTFDINASVTQSMEPI